MVRAAIQHKLDMEIYQDALDREQVLRDKLCKAVSKIK